jgi:hypothetical protein
MEEHCPKCKGKVKIENNYGQGMNFVFIIAIFVLNIFWYWPLFGLSWKDNSIYYFLGVSAMIVLLLQPWLMRYSRVLFLYLVVPFEQSPPTAST